MPKIDKYFDSGDRRIFLHHIYELQKGVRNMVLMTIKSSESEFIVERLQQKNIEYFIQECKGNKINVFFGNKECIETIKIIVNKPLNFLSPEEDFIIGMLLGYSVCQQCSRYCGQKKVSNIA